MRLIGDLVVTRARLADSFHAIESLVPLALSRGVQEHALLLERQLRDLRDGVMRVRMVPIGDVFERMTFVARDLAREQGKRVRMEVNGTRTEVDKFVVERLSDPLLHLVRNAITHGLESAEERATLGKPEEGTCTCVRRPRRLVVLDVEDDGRGVDAASVADRARQAGLVVPTNSTTTRCSTCSVRRLLDQGHRGPRERARDREAVVRRVVGEMGGVMRLDTRAAHGTRFTIHTAVDARDHRRARARRSRTARSRFRRQACAKSWR